MQISRIGIPTIAFEGGSAPRFQRVNFSIDDHQHDPMKHVCLLIRGGFVKVGAASFDARDMGLDGGPTLNPMQEKSFWLDVSNRKANPEEKKAFETEPVAEGDEEALRYRLNGLMFQPPESIRVSCFERVQ
jgi:hypothetical protein